MISLKKYILWAIAFCIGFSACDQDAVLLPEMTAEQEALIGKAVNFDASISNEFVTRTTWNNSGVFNEDDLMVIYREYYKSETNAFDPATRSYRVYSFKSTNVSGTGISLNTKWKPVAGKYGKNDTGEAFQQTDADSLTWENGYTVRYRAWSLSNLSGVLNPGSNWQGSWSSFYPDFTISDWVTASGPTMQIPLVLRHVTNRIGFRTYAGNEIYRVEICTIPEDYAWKDNSVSSTDDDNDAFDNVTILESGLTLAGEKAKEVLDVYNRMCMPGGVDLDKSELLAMSASYYTDRTNHPNTSTIERDGNLMIARATKTPAEIESDAVRPEFHPNNGLSYMVSIPYDMSNAATTGEVLVLPAHTRFRIYLRDTNNGDKNSTGGYEGKYHIVSLSDLEATNSEDSKLEGSGTKMFKDGLPLNAGYSYIFRVGYHYNSLKIESVNKDHLNWDNEVTLTADNMTDVIEPEPTTTTPYKWWKDAINDAIRKAKNDNSDYVPEFHIINENEFMEFINLVNGTAHTTENLIKRTLRTGKDAEGHDKINPDNGTNYWWYYTDDRMWTAEGDTAWIVGDSRAKAERDGYIFYNRYYPSDGDKEAYSIEELLTEPYSFYDNQVKKPFYVYLDYDLDMKDWALANSIGIYDSENTSLSKPFRGYFDGCPSKITITDNGVRQYDTTTGNVRFTTVGAGVCHTIKDIYLTTGYLFGYAQDSYISNLKIETTHKTCVLNQGVNTSIIGISLKAPSAGASIAEKLANTGTAASYVVGCIHEGEATRALVHEADNLFMYGCMQTAYDLTGGALIGTYNAKYAPQTNPKSLTWGRFMCNFYDTQHSPSAHAVGSYADTYAPQEYIRGRWTHILCAQNDNLLDKPDYYSQLSNDRKIEFYGVAPWKAMNYGIFKYNSEVGKTIHPCNAHFEVDFLDTDGYDYRYPQLKSGQPASTQYLNVLIQNN